MTQPSPPPPQDSLTVGQIVAILAAGLAAKKTLELLSRLLNPLGIASPIVKAVFLLAGPRPRLPRPSASRYRVPRGTAPLRRPGRPRANPSRPHGPSALQTTLAGETTWQAAYLYSAAQRVQRSVDQARREGLPPDVGLARAMQAEQRYHAQHVQAQARRRQVGAQVEVAAQRHGVPFIDSATGTVTRLVGWHAVLDARTSRECRIANGKVFLASRPPKIGFPGAVHPSCRCRAGAPQTGAQLLD